MPVPKNPRRATSLTKDRIVTAAIGILDEEGEAALTFRALAARLETGSGAIYWHVANKNELLTTATDALIERAISGKSVDQNPRETIRSVALGVFDAMDAHPWIGGQLSLEPFQPALVRILEGMGSPLENLGVPENQQFDVATALVSFIMGLANQYASVARFLANDATRPISLEAVADRWLALDPDEYPFTHRMARQLAHHDDRAQFLAGIDLILAGIEGTGRGL